MRRYVLIAESFFVANTDFCRLLYRLDEPDTVVPGKLLQLLKSQAPQCTISTVSRDEEQLWWHLVSSTLATSAKGSVARGETWSNLV